jgi:hypothetical protein
MAIYISILFALLSGISWFCAERVNDPVHTDYISRNGRFEMSEIDSTRIKNEMESQRVKNKKKCYNTIAAICAILCAVFAAISLLKK